MLLMSTFMKIIRQIYSYNQEIVEKIMLERFEALIAAREFSESDQFEFENYYT